LPAPAGNDAKQFPAGINMPIRFHQDAIRRIEITDARGIMFVVAGFV
jgi:hypothetical protein